MSTFTVLLCICLLAALATPTTIERIVRPVDKRKLSSSIRLTYICHLTSWTGTGVPNALGIPGFTNNTSGNPYNYVAHTFWLYPNNPADAALVWSDIVNRLGSGVSPYGTTTAEIQTTLKKNFTDAGTKLLVSAFGATQTPTTSGFSVTDCATQLANFVIANQYDGVDIDWEDTKAFNAAGDGENWLISFTTLLRSLLPAGSIITHAPQAPYFGATLYPQGAYLAVEKAVGSAIDFYNVQFYNQGKGIYEDAQGLFNVSTGWCVGTSVNEIIASGIPATKLVLGKPATSKNAKSGLMTPAALNAAITANYAYNGWNTGLFFWEFNYDLDGAICTQAGQGIITMPHNDQVRE